MIRGYIRPLPRHKAETQRAALDAAGVRSIYVEGEDGESLPEAIRALRKGDVLAVTRLWMLATPRKRTNDRPRKSLFEALKAVEDRGATVLEAATGRSTATARDYMLLDAIEWLSGQSRGSAGARNGAAGRRPAVFPPEVVAVAESVWFDQRNESLADVRKHLPKGFSVWRCYRHFGARRGT